MENEIDPALVAATSSLGAFHFPVAEAAEWDHHKPRIAELYEKKELKEVMQILKDEHGFTASYYTPSLLPHPLRPRCLSSLTIPYGVFLEQQSKPRSNFTLQPLPKLALSTSSSPNSPSSIPSSPRPTHPKNRESQYKKQLAKWGLNKKNVKSGEYKAMIRKQRDRAKDGKDTEFYIHGNKVPAVNIARFEERWRKKEGLGEGDAFDDVPTPKSLTFRTPSPEI